MLRYFFDRYKDNERITGTRVLYDEVRAVPVVDIAEAAVEDSPENWTRAVKAATLSALVAWFISSS